MQSPVFSRFALPATCLVAGLVLGVAGTLFFQPSRADREVTAAPARLSWNDLANADAARFAENLRAVGCPQETILRILTRGESAPASAPIAPPPVVVAPTPVPMPVAIPAVVAAAPMPAAATPVAPAGPEMVIVAPQGSVPLPVAFQELPQDSQMTPAQRAKLDAIQNEFIAAIGGPNQDPASPEYLNRWRQAQPKCDDAFKAAFGRSAYMRRYMATIPVRTSDVPGS